MNSVQQLSVRTSRLDEFILFLLGLFSTWQIVQVAGFAVFTLLLLGVMLYFLLSRKPVVRRDWVLLAMLILYTVTTVLSPFQDIKAGYKSTAIINYVQWIAVLVVCQYASQSDGMDGTGAFLKGLDWSCRVQIAWCFLQMLLYHLFDVNLNHEIFTEIFGFEGNAGHDRDGELVASGLHWHAANMIPVLVFTFFRSKNLLVKLICVATAYLTKTATAYIAVMLCVACEMMVVIKRALIDQSGRVKRKNAVIAVGMLVAAVLAGSLVWPRIQGMLQYLLDRILLALEPPMPGTESSATHLSYYTMIPYIYERAPLVQILFGTGFNTSGHYFSQYMLQYTDQIWVLESDIANELLSTGILGMLAHYVFIFATVARMRGVNKADRQYWAPLVLIVCGIFYNNQFIWVLLVEMMLYSHARRQKRLKYAAARQESRE